MQNGFYSLSDNYSKENHIIPEWDLTSIYKNYKDPAYIHDKQVLKQKIKNILELIENNAPSKNAAPASWIHKVIKEFENIYDLDEQLQAFAFAQYAACTTESKHLSEINTLESLAVPIKRAEALFRKQLGAFDIDETALKQEIPDYYSYKLFISEQQFLRNKQMDPSLEDLAADLSRSGADAWSRLQQAVSSTLKTVWDKQTGEEKTVNQLRSLAFDSSRSVREKAFQKEIELWKSAATPIAYALNGVKGATITVNKRRNYNKTLDRSIFQTRISKKTLDALFSAVKNYLPSFQKYLFKKAQLLGLKKLAFYDLFAPITKSEKKWNFSEAKEFIIDKLSDFNPEIGNFAEQAFKNNWIDAKPREGKVGGAFCISYPNSGQSRILCNFDGSFSSVSTIAHELGHAYHHHILRDTKALARNYPMTLAETASIFSEKIIFSGGLETTLGEERLGILETSLQDATQVIVDILSRFIFEHTVFEKREEKELSPDEFSDIMIHAQKEAYGSALDENYLHPYMWAAKPHYYRSEFSYYNFPYSFGLLFGLGLYSIYQQEGPAFFSRYKEVLSKTGQMTAIELGGELGFNLEDTEFWKSGLEIIKADIERFCKET